jgi:hypothetical protein
MNLNNEVLFRDHDKSREQIDFPAVDKKEEVRKGLQMQINFRALIQQASLCPAL